MAKKEKEMTKEENNNMLSETTEATPLEYAVSLYYDSKLQHWNFVKVAFDPVKKQASEVTMLDIGPSKDEAVQAFKVFVGRNFL